LIRWTTAGGGLRSDKPFTNVAEQTQMMLISQRTAVWFQPRGSMRVRSDVEAIWDADFAGYLSAYRAYGDPKKRGIAPKATDSALES
jgi:hypothetical protein